MDAPAGVPALGGVLEYANQGPNDLLVRLDKPGPGVAAFGSFDMGGQIMVAVSFYRYGDQAAETTARETPLWQAWFQKRFPVPTEPSRQQYHMLMEFRDEKIASVREYLDTQHAYDVWVAPLSEAEVALGKGDAGGHL